MATSIDDPLPELLRALKNRSPAERVRAAKALGRLGWLARDAMPALMNLMADEDAKVRESAAQAVGQMGPDALPALCAMLTHEDKYVRRHTVWAMGKLGPLAQPALPDLREALKDPDPRTASGAAQAIGNMGAEGAEGVPALAEAMRGTNIVLCRLAAKALSQVGLPALATLIAHLQHADPFVRGESALALGWMGVQARSAVPFLAAALRGSRSITHRTPPPGTLTAEIRTPTTPPMITPPPEGTSTEDNARIYAAQALGRIGPAAAPAMAELHDAARNGSDALRQAAHTAIRLIEG